MSKKELVLKAFNNEKTERVPVGFWFHFLQDEFNSNALENEEFLKENIEGHKKFVESFNPDFVKIMSDGYFNYPNPLLKTAKSIKDLKNIQSIGADHPWITAQVNLVKKVIEVFPEDVLGFYNIFAPATYLKWGLKEKDQALASFIKEDEDLTKEVLTVIANDIAILVKRILEETKAGGIYFSSQEVQDDRITAEDFVRVIKPSDLIVLKAANSVTDNNILHICGFEGAANDISIYKDYPAKVINWAIGPEKLSLEDGKKYFDNKAVIAGFDNGFESILYTGNKEEITDKTKELLDAAGTTGVILGADCTVPRDIDINHLKWVREAAEAY